MNDDRLLDLDDRAAAAATDVRQRAAARPRPAFDADGSTVFPVPPPVDRRQAWRPLLAAAAVIVVLVGIAAALSVRSGDDVDGVAGPGTDDPRPFAATDPPGGLVLVGGFEAAVTQSDPDGLVGPVPLELYGPSDDRPGLGVAMGWQPNVEETGGATIDLGDGRTALVADDMGLAGSALIFEIGTTPVLMISQELDASALADVAALVTLDDERRAVVPEGGLPEGWRHIGTEPDLLGAVSPLWATTTGGGGAQKTVLYRSPISGSPTMAAVSSTGGDVARLNVVRLVLRDVQEVTVRGHDGLVGTASGEGEAELRTLVWLERPGELVRVSGLDLTFEELLTLAEGLEPLDADAWSDLQRRTRLGELAGPDGGPPTEPIGEGTFADGSAWVLRGTSSDDGGAGTLSLSLSLSVDTGADGPGSTSVSSSGSATSEGGPDPATGLLDFNTMEQADRRFVYGALGPDVATVELRRGDGTVLTEASVVEGQGVRAWVAELTEPQADVVAIDEAGREVERVEVRDDGNDVGFPAGPTTTITGDGGALSQPEN